MTRLSVVVPCHNEEEGIPRLLSVLDEVRASLGPDYVWEVVFVDDGSRDRTWDILQAARPARPEMRTVRHEVNRGLGAALRTGFQHATGDLVATIDSDCTYDPREIVTLVRMIRDGADVVVASPYHPNGAVLNVPAYRIFLSKHLSRLYRVVLGSSLYTYTSLFRLYRAEVLRTIVFEANGFVAMAEILVAALLKGFRVVEFPTRLSVREYGESKAAIFRLMKDHMRLLSHLIRHRVRVPSMLESAAPHTPGSKARS